jgi:uncharacterized protein YuzE
VVSLSVRFGGIEFDNVFYDREADVLYLHIGESRTAVDWGESPEGHHLRFGANGQLVGITVVNPRWLLERDGRIVVTLPQMTVEESDLADVLSAA